MIGREITNIYPKRKKTHTDEVVLKVEKLSHKDAYRDISFELHKGEVLGMAGLVGAGRTEIARGIFGIDYKDSGDIYINGSKVKINSPADAIKYGICYLSEDRKSEGLMGSMSVKHNISAANVEKLLVNGVLSQKKEEEIANELVEALKVKTSGLEQTVFNLSGGNMQKVVLAKWLNTNVDIFIFDEPTRGIDVGAKSEVYRILRDIAKEGIGILMVSSELPELLALCDRILVMHEGRLTGERSREEASEELIMKYAAAI